MRPTLRRWWFLLVVGGVGVVFVVRPGDGTSTAVAAPAKLRERMVVRGEIVPADGMAKIRARVDGRVLSVTVKEGERVKAGQVLATIEADTLQAEVARRDALHEALVYTATSTAQGARDEEREALAAEARAAARELSLARDRAARAQALGSTGSIAQVEVTESQHAVDIAQAHLDAAEARLKLAATGARSAEVSAAREHATAADAARAEARSSLAWTRIVAPRDGLVASRRVDEGDTITGTATGVTPPLFEICDDSRVEVRIEVENLEADRVVPGLEVEVTRVAARSPIGHGTIARVGGRLAPRTVGANNALERAEGWVRPAWADVAWQAGAPPIGERVEVKVLLPAREVAAALPRGAIVVEDGAAFVEVRRLLYWERVPVEISASDESMVALTRIDPRLQVRVRP